MDKQLATEHTAMFQKVAAAPKHSGATTRRLAMSESHGVNTSGVSQPTEKRRASDGAWYTYAQFSSHYGAGAYWYWVSAEKQTASEVSDGRQPQPPAVTPPAPTATNYASDGTHLAGDDKPLQALPPCPVLTLEELRNRAPVQGMAGKAACRKQRELRAICLRRGIFHIDLTNDAWNWRDVLRSLPAAVQADLVGPGVTHFRFRLLENVRDPNWARIDSGEKHVFEIERCDGSTCHLHYHKNGKMDPPQYPVPPNAGLETALNRGVSQPAGISLGEGAAQTVYSASYILTPNSHESEPVCKKRSPCGMLSPPQRDPAGTRHRCDGRCRLSLAEVPRYTDRRP